MLAPFFIKYLYTKNIRMKVVIVGGGFGGLNLAKKLVCKKDFEITLVDTNNYNFFPPLLYQVSTAFIEPSNITYPFRKMFQGKSNFRFYMGSLININTQENYIETDTGNVEYDTLVLGMGTETNYFGIENIKRYALPMKTIDDALNLRNHLLLNIEKVVRMSDGAEREKLQNIVIAGGGPTGVEISGMLAEMRKNIYGRTIPNSKTFVVISISLMLPPCYSDR